MEQFLEYYENSSMGESAVHALREEEEVRRIGARGGELRVRLEGVDEVPPGWGSTALSVFPPGVGDEGFQP